MVRVLGLNDAIVGWLVRVSEFVCVCSVFLGLRMVGSDGINRVLRLRDR